MTSRRTARRRNEALQALSRFDIRRVYNNGNPFYRVRPRGFDTILFDVHRPAHVASTDFDTIMTSIETLAEPPRP